MRDTVFEIIDRIEKRVNRNDGSNTGRGWRISHYIEPVAKKLINCNYEQCASVPDFLDNLVLASRVHDIGKLEIPEQILKKKGRLTESEFETVKKHTVFGERMISELFRDYDDTDFVRIARECALYHHEKWDGSGYPEGLSGTDIPLPARIMAVIDVYDALLSRKPYKNILSKSRSVSIILSGRGTEFDPKVVDAFMETIGGDDDISGRVVLSDIPCGVRNDPRDGKWIASVVHNGRTVFLEKCETKGQALSVKERARKFIKDNPGVTTQDIRNYIGEGKIAQ